MMETDSLIVGGGFYGCCLSLFLRGSHSRVLVVERELELLTGACSATRHGCTTGTTTRAAF